MSPSHPYSGESVIQQLKRFGSNLDEKHEMSFWLYFPEEKTARRAADRAKKTGLSTEVVRSVDNRWLCLILCPHAPDEALIDAVMEFSIGLASEFGGEFDGWESSLTTSPEEIEELLKNLKSSSRKRRHS